MESWKYRANIYADLKEYWRENYNHEITNEEIDKMPRSAVLRAWLEWQGIIGYTYDILGIMGVKSDE